MSEGLTTPGIKKNPFLVLKGSRGIKGKKWLTILSFLGPSVLAFLLFSYYPMLQSIKMSFFNYNLVNPPGPFVGLSNYVTTLTSPKFLGALRNTVILFLFGLALGFWVPILQALFLNEIKGRWRGFFQYLYLLPMAVPGIGVFVIWKWIWNPDYGLANAVLNLVHLPPQLWLNDPKLVLLTLRLPALIGGGMGLMFYFAAVQNVPQEIMEAAIVDGANAWQRMFRITLPNIKGIIFIQFILALSGSLLAFDDVFVMTNGGPGNASETLVFGLYNIAFGRAQKFGEATAWAVLILIVTIILTSLQMRFAREANQ